jgi:hypothetical protein
MAKKPRITIIHLCDNKKCEYHVSNNQFGEIPCILFFVELDSYGVCKNQKMKRVLI